MIKASEDFAKEAGLTNYQPPNTTILHTESSSAPNSHSCSTGGLGAFAIGLGAADVLMPVVTGETWIKVPRPSRSTLSARRRSASGGKDVMLYTLGQLKCNTVATGRCVEWGGNIAALSCDARFAISTCRSSLAASRACFPATSARPRTSPTRESHKDDALYFRADPDAQYAARFEIDLTNLEPQPVKQLVGMKLDGCFIGACTTAEEDLVLGALVLEACMKQGMTPVPHGQRRVTPGSQRIINHLRAHGLLDVYCLGIAADVAGGGRGLAQFADRNYRNRMGKGSIGNLASAITAERVPITISEPQPEMDGVGSEASSEATATAAGATGATGAPAVTEELPAQIKGRAQVFGDNIDTDAILPGEFLIENDVEKLGKVAFLYTNPDFRDKVHAGQNIVVAGHGFGCGSSREAGRHAVIARSFGYIFSRNYQNFSLMGIPLQDDRFYELAKENSDITINVKGRTIEVGGEVFRFNMSVFEERLLAGGGIMPLYKKYGNRLFRVAVQDPKDAASALARAVAVAVEAPRPVVAAARPRRPPGATRAPATICRGRGRPDRLASSCLALCPPSVAASVHQCASSVLCSRCAAAERVRTKKKKRLAHAMAVAATESVKIPPEWLRVPRFSQRSELYAARQAEMKQLVLARTQAAAHSTRRFGRTEAIVRDSFRKSGVLETLRLDSVPSPIEFHPRAKVSGFATRGALLGQRAHDRRLESLRFEPPEIMRLADIPKPGAPELTDWWTRVERLRRRPVADDRDLHSAANKHPSADCWDLWTQHESGTPSRCVAERDALRETKTRLADKVTRITHFAPDEYEAQDRVPASIIIRATDLHAQERRASPDSESSRAEPPRGLPISPIKPTALRTHKRSQRHIENLFLASTNQRVLLDQIKALSPSLSPSSSSSSLSPSSFSPGANQPSSPSGLGQRSGSSFALTSSPVDQVHSVKDYRGSIRCGGFA
ncbi:hypothetical protein PINS_up021589 [Pythium insidiosum]|nr:hypothetical protein PINS_up021589 [Pythium insidiosum]